LFHFTGQKGIGLVSTEPARQLRRGPKKPVILSLGRIEAI
jgi:hypothetical protein